MVTVGRGFLLARGLGLVAARYLHVFLADAVDHLRVSGSNGEQGSGEDDEAMFHDD